MSKPRATQKELVDILSKAAKALRLPSRVLVRVEQAKSAQEALAILETYGDVAPAPAPIEPPDAGPKDLEILSKKEHELAKAQNKIGAIKAVRERTNLGLKEARDLVVKYYPGNLLPSTPVGY